MGSTPIPRKVHFMVLGETPPPFMISMVEWSMAKLNEEGFETKLWDDEQAEKLVADFGNAELSQAWEYVKTDPKKSRMARMADFLRPFILYVEGGVYLDADMVPCGGLEYMVDEPGMVSFPFKRASTTDNEVNGAAMSAPPRHRLMGLALETFAQLGPSIGTLNNLEAAGPHIFARIVDTYLAGIGVEIPSMYDRNSPYELEPLEGVIDESDAYWRARVADLRFAFEMGGHPHGSYHMAMRTWQGRPEETEEPPCHKDTNLIAPWLDEFCKGGSMATACI